MPLGVNPARVQPDVSVIIPSVSQADHLDHCLASLQRDAVTRATFEVVVVANGATSRVQTVARRAGVRVIDSPVNRGFAGGCVLGASHAHGLALCFLNDDVVVTPGWLDPLIETLSKTGVAAVGPLVRYPDGRIQEAGSVLWRDGSSRPIGHGAPDGSVAPRVRRRVDYCSASALLVSRAAWDAAGGFDQGYHPAYFEDVDFALRLEQLGLEVWVDPRGEVLHAESQSSAPSFKQFLFARNRARLVTRWPHALAERLPPPCAEPLEEAVAAAIARLAPAGPRVLVVDDRVPAYGLGSGFDRMVDVLLRLSDARFDVSFAATATPPTFEPLLAAHGIAVLDDASPGTLRRALAHVDAVVASRPNNGARVWDAVADLPARPRLVYDAEALYHRRVERQARFSRGAEASALYDDAARWRDIEASIARRFDTVVCVSQDEAAFFLAHGARDVRVFTPWLRRAAPGEATLAGRRDIGFVAGWLAGDNSPNADALRWFTAEVLPLVAAYVPWVRLRVTGEPPPALRHLEGPSVKFEGFVPDLAAFYRRLRVVAVPLRFGSGVKLKTLEAMQHGVPVVATTVGSEGLPAGAPLDCHDDPEGLAGAIVAMLTDPAAWRARRRALDEWTSSLPAVAECWADVVAEAGRATELVDRAL